MPVDTSAGRTIASPLKEHPKPLYQAEVVATEQLSPNMVRVVLGGAGLRNFVMNDTTDAYVKLIFPHPDTPDFDPVAFDPKTTEIPRELWPTTRTYTIRSWDESAKEASIDFVSHGDQGLAGPWAARAKPRDTILLRGPGGAYRPSADSDWHLLAGDDAALPAIHAAWDALPNGAVAHAFVEIPGEADELDITAKPGCTWTWLHRNTSHPGTLWFKALQDFDWIDGTPQCFVHGEAGAVRDARRHLRNDRNVPMSHLSISGYWRTGLNEDGWQSSKKAWNQAIADEEYQPKP